MKQEKLALHSHLLPMLQAVAAQEEEGWGDTHGVLATARDAKVFDCRKLDLAFLKDTGEAAIEEWNETKQIVRLPFDQCWFELSDGGGIVAWEVEVCGVDREGVTVEIISFDGEHEPGFIKSGPSGERGWSRGCFQNDVLDSDLGPLDYFHTINTDSPATEIGLKWAGEMLVGILALMRDRLLAVEVKPDLDARLNKARAKAGRLPLSSETRVLTLNLAAVRGIAKPAEGSHESPRLHWRRGHWRVLHRGEPAERRTWIKRCLVGDVDKGWVHKDYRMVWRPPMMEAA